MKVQVIYTSACGSTKKLAEGIFAGLDSENKSIHNLAEGVPESLGEVLLLGYWADKGGPSAKMERFLSQLSGKYVGIFCTLGYFSDSDHGNAVLQRGISAVKEKNTLIGSYVCNGATSPKLIAHARTVPEGRAAATPEKELRWDLMQNHPTSAEIALAQERFQERLQLLQQVQQGNLQYPVLY